MSRMRVEILITADVIDFEDEKEIQESIRKSISNFVHPLENVDHEVAFVDEGLFDYFSKKCNPEQYKQIKADKYEIEDD